MPGNLANTQDLVPIEEVREGTVVLKNGDLRQILIVGGINFSLKSEAEQNIITQGYQNFLNSVDFPLQIIIHSRKLNIERYLSSLDERQGQETSGLLRDQITEYREFIRKFVNENAIMSKTFLVVVPFTPIGLPGKDTISGMFPFGKKGPAADAQHQAAKQADFEHNLAQLKQRMARVAEGLIAIGLEAVPLNDEQLVELFYNFYNPGTVEKESVNPARAKQ